jgi:hypothetical protein
MNADPSWMSGFADPTQAQGDITGTPVPMTQAPSAPPQFQMAPAQPTIQGPGTFAQPNLNYQPPPDPAAQIATQEAMIPTQDPYAGVAAVENKTIGDINALSAQEQAAAGQEIKTNEQQMAELESKRNAATEMMNKEWTARQEAAKALEAQQMAKAAELQSMESKLDLWAMNTPTRQASYAAAMHMAAPLSILAAVGGAVTHANGLAMLNATTGVVEGINKGAENQFQDAMTKWQAAYERMRDHQATMEKVHNTYLEAYQGRLDAQDKAVEHARTVMGDQLQMDQLKIGNSRQNYLIQRDVLKDSANWKLAIDKIAAARAARLGSAQMINAQDVDFRAWRLLQGEDPSKVFYGMPRGVAGMPLQNAIWNRVRELYAYQHQSDPQYAGKPELMNADAAQFVNNAREQHVAQNRALLQAAAASAKIQVADRMLQNSIPMAKAASDQVSRLPWRPLQEYLQKGELAANFPAMHALAVRANAVQADYKAMQQRFGTSAISEREQWADTLMTASSKQAFDTDLYNIQQEGEANVQATRQAMDPRMYAPAGGWAGATGGNYQPTPYQAPGTTPPPGWTGMPGSGGTPAAPAPGTVSKGYRFKGGNPADRNNWEPVGG